MNPKLALGILGLTLLALIVRAQNFTGPVWRDPNFLSAKTEHSSIALETTDGWEWLVLRGNPHATTLDEQWGPQAIVINCRREPIVTKVEGGWEIRFKTRP